MTESRKLLIQQTVIIINIKYMKTIFITTELNIQLFFPTLMNRNPEMAVNFQETIKHFY